jgi:hypothetical protein
MRHDMAERTQFLLSAFHDHLVITLTVTFVLFFVSIAAFAEGQFEETVTGMFRLMLSVFTAPFYYLQSAVRAIRGFRQLNASDAHRSTFLLWRTVQYSRFVIFLLAILLGSGGIATALTSLWPSKQLEERTSLQTSLARADSVVAVDSMKLLDPALADPERASAVRKSRLTVLPGLRDSAERAVNLLADSVNAIKDSVHVVSDSVIIATRPRLPDGSLFAAEIQPRSVSEGFSDSTLATLKLEYKRAVWDPVLKAVSGPTNDSTIALLASYGSRAIAASEGFLAIYKGHKPAHAEMLNRLMRAWVRYNSLSQELRILRTSPTPAEIVASLQSQLQGDRVWRTGILRQLGAIDYLSGIPVFLTTLGVTYLYLAAFLWTFGTGIEWVSTFVGISRDLETLRERSTNQV